MTTARVQPRPYTEESARATSRTTAEERTKWRFIAQRDYYICRETEPEDSWRNRVFWRGLGTEGRKQASEDTLAEIRSLPDYDGPPMRAPSGPVFEFARGSDIVIGQAPVENGTVFLSAETEKRARGRNSVLQRLAEIARSGFEVTHVRPSNAELIGEATLDLFDLPSQGGRGWCPKLAGAQP